MKRALKLGVLGYVLAGLIALGLERAGVYQCGCEPDCWCKRPGLSLFRWVLPRWHKNQAIAAWKRRRSSATPAATFTARRSADRHPGSASVPQLRSLDTRGR